MATSARQKAILKTMGIPVWTAHRAISGQKLAENLLVSPVEDDWSLLQSEVNDCTACDLHLSRTNPVFGVGNTQADLLIIGEAPGVDEDAKGEPFVGPAGQLLNRMLFSLGLSRGAVFILNTVKCFPPDDRKPTKQEIEACSSFVFRQIQLVNPKVILCVGAASAKSLLHSKETISRLRGQLYAHQETGIPLIATYHPAYLLRKPTEKRAVWHDLLLVKKQLDEA